MPVLRCGVAEGSREEWRDASQFVGMVFIIAVELLWTTLWLKGHIINTSSVNGFWATLNGVPHTSYSALNSL